MEAPLIYGLVVPRSHLAVDIPAGLLHFPPALAVAGMAMADILAGVAGLARFCHRVRMDPQAIWFLPAAGAPHAMLESIPAAVQPIPFRLSAQELLFCRWFGHSLFAGAELPPAEAFAGLSDAHLCAQVVDLLQKLNGGRFLEAAVYQKLNDILNRGWEKPPIAAPPAREARSGAPSGVR